MFGYRVVYEARGRPLCRRCVARELFRGIGVLLNVCNPDPEPV